jgi:hypothetical protein
MKDQTAVPGTEPQLTLFYNTTNLSQQELMERYKNTKKQDTKVLHFFRDNPKGMFTPFDVQYLANLNHVPITSIRRAINSLTQEGLLIKTDHMKAGQYGAMNHTWKKA